MSPTYRKQISYTPPTYLFILSSEGLAVEIVFIIARTLEMYVLSASSLGWWNLAIEACRTGSLKSSCTGGSALKVNGIGS